MSDCKYVNVFIKLLLEILIITYDFIMNVKTTHIVNKYE